MSVDYAALICRQCDAVKEMLVEKNKAYGASAFEPLRVFSKAGPEEQILTRIDDKLSRIAKGSSAGEDAVLDLIGYLVLLRVSRQLAAQSPLGAARDEAPSPSFSALTSEGE